MKQGILNSYIFEIYHKNYHNTSSTRHSPVSMYCMTLQFFGNSLIVVNPFTGNSFIMYTIKIAFLISLQMFFV